MALAGGATCLAGEVLPGVCFGDSTTFVAAAFTGVDAGATGAAGFVEVLGFCLGARLTDADFGDGAFRATDVEMETPLEAAIGAGTVEDFCAEGGIGAFDAFFPTVEAVDTVIGAGFARDAPDGLPLCFAADSGLFVPAGGALGWRVGLRFAGLFFFI